MIELTFGERPQRPLPRAGTRQKYENVWVGLLRLENDDWLRIDAASVGGLDTKAKVQALCSSAKLALNQKLQVVPEDEFLYVRFRHRLSDDVTATLLSNFMLKAKIPVRSLARLPPPPAGLAEVLAPPRTGLAPVRPQIDPMVTMAATIERALDDLALLEVGEVVSIELGNNPNLYSTYQREVMATAAAKKMAVETEREATELIVQLVKGHKPRPWPPK